VRTLFEVESNSLIFVTHPRNHIEYDYSAVTVAGSFDSFVKYRKFAIKSFLSISLIGAVVASPWWESVILTHGFETFLYAFPSRSGALFGIIQAIVGMDSFVYSVT